MDELEELVIEVQEKSGKEFLQEFMENAVDMSPNEERKTNLGISTNDLRKALSYAMKQGPPGPPPRLGLEWKPTTHRWIRPEEDPSETGFDYRCPKCGHEAHVATIAGHPLAYWDCSKCKTKIPKGDIKFRGIPPKGRE